MVVWCSAAESWAAMVERAGHRAGASEEMNTCSLEKTLIPSF